MQPTKDGAVQEGVVAFKGHSNYSRANNANFSAISLKKRAFHIDFFEKCIV